jgi:hypothetical protein
VVEEGRRYFESEFAICIDVSCHHRLQNAKIQMPFGCIKLLAVCGANCDGIYVGPNKCVKLCMIHVCLSVTVYQCYGGQQSQR